MTYWFLWLFVARVRQHGSDRLKASHLIRHVVITKFTHAQTCDHCVIFYVLPLVFNKSMIPSTISWSPSLENPDSYSSRETTFVSAGLPVLRLEKETELTCFHSEDLYCYCLYFNF